MSEKTVLLKAANLIEESGWARGWFAKTRENRHTTTKGKDAVKFCAAGAIERVCRSNMDAIAARMALHRYIREHKLADGVAEWNDKQKSSAAVIATMRAVAEAL